MTALVVSGLGGGYGSLTVLNGVDLSVESGMLQVILGRNGAGKTSLLSAIMGLLPTINAGSVSLDGKDITSMPAHRRAAAGVGLVQEGKRIFRARTVEENLLLGAYSVTGIQLRSRGRKMALQSAYERFPVLREKRKERAGGLSGGQQQMLAIAQALASKPSVLLLDEPSAGLAPSVRAEVFKAATGLRDEGLAVIVVEQLVDAALEVADDVAVLDSGKIVSSGKPEKFADGSLLQEIYLG